jgi:hypothetical protein
MGNEIKDIMLNWGHSKARANLRLFTTKLIDHIKTVYAFDVHQEYAERFCLDFIRTHTAVDFSQYDFSVIVPELVAQAGGLAFVDQNRRKATDFESLQNDFEKLRSQVHKDRQTDQEKIAILSTELSTAQTKVAELSTANAALQQRITDFEANAASRTEVGEVMDAVEKRLNIMSLNTRSTTEVLADGLAQFSYNGQLSNAVWHTLQEIRSPPNPQSGNVEGATSSHNTSGME